MNEEESERFNVFRHAIPGIGQTNLSGVNGFQKLEHRYRRS